MSQSRREFLRQGSYFATGSLLAFKQFWKDKAIQTPELVGIQLYSVRDDMHKDPSGTLTILASMGYKYVEHANYVNRKFYGYSPADFKKLLEGLGLKMPSGHTVLRASHWNESTKDFTDDWKYTVEDAALLGQQYVISPALEMEQRKDYDSLMRFMDIFNKSGELCQKSGMKFSYHNHDFEFSQQLNGKSMYALILDNTDPNYVIQQLDTGNLYNGGAKAMDIVKKYPGRFQSLHVKDEIPASGGGHEKYESCVLGKGIVNLKEVIDMIRKNTKNVHYIIEQESYQGKAPLDCAREDLAVMKKWGYEK